MDRYFDEIIEKLLESKEKHKERYENPCHLNCIERIDRVIERFVALKSKEKRNYLDELSL